MEQLNAEAAGQEEAELRRLNTEEARYRMELQVRPSLAQFYWKQQAALAALLNSCAGSQ